MDAISPPSATLFFARAKAKHVTPFGFGFRVLGLGFRVLALAPVSGELKRLEEIINI